MSSRHSDHRNESLSELVEFSWRQFIKRIHTVAPGIVREYDGPSRRARVQPAFKLTFTDDTPPMAKPPIVDVPVVTTSGGGFLVHCPLMAGDPVLLLFSERGLDHFKAAHEVSDPAGPAMFAERDAIAVPGFGPTRITPAEGLTMQTNDGETYISLTPGRVKIRASEIILQGDTDTWRIP